MDAGEGARARSDLVSVKSGEEGYAWTRPATHANFGQGTTHLAAHIECNEAQCMMQCHLLEASNAVFQLKIITAGVLAEWSIEHHCTSSIVGNADHV